MKPDRRDRKVYQRELRKRKRAHFSAYYQHRKEMYPELYAYISAKQRCTNPKNPGYCRYGGRGIKFMLTSWHDIVAAIGRRPSSEYSLDRVNNDGHYEVGNLRWATWAQQCANRRNR